MVLKVIYVVRHGYRSNWVVDPQTGTYSSNIRSPTGIPSDPALASYGVLQAEQLGAHLAQVDPPVDLVYSSPFYRCIQTLSPFTNALVEKQSNASKAIESDDDGGKASKVKVTLEPGLGEFYGTARFDHPSPATLSVLNTHFPHLHAENDPIITPSTKGESIPQLHDRLAYCLHHIIKTADASPQKPRSLLICTHAAAMIAIGRALTGRMPEDEGEEDFNCFTCSFSKFVRRAAPESVKAFGASGEAKAKWHSSKPDDVPDVDWRKGRGVGGGWECVVNGDCSFLQNGEERGWRFSGDESFLNDPNAFNDTANTVETTVPTASDDNAISDGVGGKGKL